MTIPKQKNDLLFWAALTAAVLLVILFFGLRSKGLRVVNSVSLFSDKGALVFGKYGSAFVDDVISGHKISGTDQLTIEMAMRADTVNGRGFRSLLMMHDGSDRRQLFVGQWHSSIVIMNGNDYDHTRRLPRLSAKDTFSTEKIRFITVTAGERGTRLYVDGTLASADKNWRLEVPLKGKKLRLVLGNSVTGKHGWTGEIYGLAMYGQALSPETVKRHYQSWIRNDRFPKDATDALLLLYTFRERGTNLVPDLSGHDQPLQIPSRLTVLHRKYLSPPWHDFKPDRSFVVDATLNLIGFIPLGAVLYGWFGLSLSWPGKYVIPGALVFCCLLSLSIEMLQAWMPTRSSSLLDLTLNTLGAGLGMLLLKRIGGGPPLTKKRTGTL